MERLCLLGFLREASRDMAEERRILRRELLTAGLAGFVGLAQKNQSAAAPPAARPQVQDQYQQLVLAAGPVAYWRLGEAAAASIAVDETGNQHDGTFHGKPKFGEPAALRGSRNGAVGFDGNTYLEIPDHPAFSQPTSGQGLSVELWLRPDRLDFPGDRGNSYIHWLGKGEAGRQEWGFRFYNSSDPERPNRISAYLWNLDGGLGAGAYFQDLLPVGQWIYIVACFPPGDANTRPTPGVQIYKNAALRNGPPNSGTLYADPKWKIMPQRGTAPVRLGKRDGNGMLIGALDEVAIYSRVLTSDEIQLHYAVGLGRKLSAQEFARIKKLYAPHKCRPHRVFRRWLRSACREAGASLG